MNRRRVSSKKRPSTRTKLPTVYIYIDFECVRVRQWSAFGAVVVDDMGKLLETFEVGCDRTVDDDKKTTEMHADSVESNEQFWRKHRQAKAYCNALGAGKTVENGERHIVEYFVGLESRYKPYWLLSDNPSYDVALLDDILLRNGHPAVCNRHGSYYQALDTWSYRLLYLSLNKCRSRDIPMQFAALDKTNVVYDDTTLKTWLLDHPEGGRHSPLYDAVVGADAHLMLLSLTK